MAGPVPPAAPGRWSARYFLVWLAIIAVWQAVVAAGLPTSLFLPAPSRIVAALMSQVGDGTLPANVLSTITRIAAGLLLGAGAGAVLGVGMGTSAPLRRAVDPLVAALHPIPRLAFFPLLIVLFGVGEVSKLSAVALSAFFPMLLNTVAGIRGLNPVHLELARSFGAGRRQMFTRVLLPGSLPLMLTGLRLSANLAFHATIGIEMVGSRTGLGSMLWLAWQTFRIDRLYAVLVVIAAIGIGQAALIAWLTSRAAPWMAEPQEEP